MKLTTPQAAIISDTHRFRVLVCGRKFGKTTLSSEELVAAAVSKPGQRILYIAPTLGDARRLMWQKLKDIVKRAVVRENDTRLELEIKVPEFPQETSTIFLGSWELVQNYRGDEFDLIVFDEVQEYRNFWVGWLEAMRPTLSPRKGAALFMGTPKGYNHLYDLYCLEMSDKDFKSYRFTSYDNPFLDPEEIEVAKKQLTFDQFQQEYMAEFRKAEGLVMKEFSRDKHMYTEPVFGFNEKMAGVDFGYTNPCAVLTVLYKDGNYYVSQELYKTGLTDIEVAEYVAAGNFNRVYPDPENPAGIEEMRRKRINVREVMKGKDSIEHGINKVRELFKAERLFIHKSCINLITELETYSYGDAVSYKNQSEKPIDQFNHAIDALRYVIMMHSPKKPMVQFTFRDKTVEIWRGK